MLNFQKLQNLASIQHQKRTHSPVPAQLTGLAAGLTNALCLPSPLNLSLGSSEPNMHANDVNDNECAATAASILSSANVSCSTQMPQLILASGQIIQGIQGAQLLIPTSQGM